MHQNGIVVFSSRHQLVKEVLLDIVTKTMEVHVFLALV
jgi:hypothetical protein